MTADAPPFDKRDLEERQLKRWLTQRFDSLGFEHEQIRQLMHWGVNWRYAAHVVDELGCPHDIFMELVRPFDAPPDYLPET